MHDEQLYAEELQQIGPAQDQLSGGDERTTHTWTTAHACSVAICSPHELDAEGLGDILRDAGCVLSCPPLNLDSLLGDLGRRRPDVVLLDSSWCGDGMSNVRMLSQQGHSVVVLVSPEHDEGFVQELMSAGARGCLSVLDAPQRFAECLKLVSRGAVAMSADLARTIVPAMPKAEHGPDGHHLSKREELIALRVAEGASNKEIGDELLVSPYVIKKELEHILNKLQLRNRLQLAAYVADKGLLPDIHLR